MAKMMMIVLGLLFFIGAFSSCAKDRAVPKPDDGSPSDTVYVQTTPWNKWVFGHWVWEGEGTTQSARALVDDYAANDIPIDAIIIDSPWETAYNSFEWDSTLYPGAKSMIDYFHSKNIKVICWITGGIDTNLHPIWDYARDHNYLMKESASSGPAIVKWWKPTRCSLIDWYNPDAVAWWKNLMDKTLAYGIDGWKCDGSDFLLYDLQTFKTYFYSPYLQGNIPSRNDYSDRYYRLFYDYTRQKLGNDRAIMCRPIDNYGYSSVSGSFVAFGPKDISWCNWVGDQDATFGGMKAALNNMYESAAYGYYSFGSDIGGYRTDNAYATGRSKELFLRWAQLSTFSGLMENGGGGEHRPWMFDAETNQVYKNLVAMRRKYLVGYLMESMKKSVAQNVSLMTFFTKSDYSYLLGEDIFVTPILQPSGQATINFPAGSDWVYLYDSTQVFTGGQSLTKTFPLSEFPVYLKQGTHTQATLKPM